jgi:hypothetical protein
MATAQTRTEDAPAVRVIGQGTLEGSGYPFLLVTSASELGRCHVVSYSYEGAFVGSRAVCDCIAAQYGKSCKHVLVARAWLAGVSVSESRVPTGYGAKSAPRESLLTRTRPFSILK